MSTLIDCIHNRHTDKALRLLEWHTPNDRQSVIDSIQETNRDGETCLHWCALKNSIKVFRSIVDVFGNNRATRATLIRLIQQQNRNGSTCIHWCAYNDSIQVFRDIMDVFREDRTALIDLIQQPNRNGMTCLHVCVNSVSIKIFRIIIHHFGEELDDIIVSSRKMQEFMGHHNIFQE
jgi:ankyrin repeat protein